MKKTSLMRVFAIGLAVLPLASFARQWTLQD